MQGDPSSPLLFILVVDILLGLLRRVGGLGIIEGIWAQREFGDILNLWFAHDTLLFYASKMEIVLAAKAILLAFKGASGLKINFHKSSMIYLNVGDEKVVCFAS